MGLKHIDTLKEITQTTDQERVVNSVTWDDERPKNNKESESVARVISEKTVSNKLRNGHYDVGISGHMGNKRRHKYGGSPVHRKIYAEIVKFGNTGGVKI